MEAEDGTRGWLSLSYGAILLCFSTHFHEFQERFLLFHGALFLSLFSLLNGGPIGLIGRVMEERMNISSPFPDGIKLTLDWELLASLIELAYDAIIVRDPASNIFLMG
jgi:hypothetical protein